METIIELLEKYERGILNGHLNPLDSYIELKKLSLLVKDIMDDVKEDAIVEAEKYGRGEHEHKGVKFQVKNGAGRWSFKDCEWWDKYQSMQKLSKEAYKLQKDGKTVVDEDGVVVDPAEYTEGGQVLTIKI